MPPPRPEQSEPDGHIRTVARQLVPGIVFPGLIYLVVSRRAPVLVALAAASSVPVLDALAHLSRRKRPTVAGLVFVAGTGVSVGLAVHLRSPLFILAKGAVVSGLLGVAFALSVLLGRPLARTLALRLSAPHPEGRRRLAEQWAHPRAHEVFRALSLGWAVLLLAMAGQQAGLALTVSPGIMMAVDGPVHAVLTFAGIGASVLYVRRIQLAHPDLGLLPVRS